MEEEEQEGCGSIWTSRRLDLSLVGHQPQRAPEDRGGELEQRGEAKPFSGRMARRCEENRTVEGRAKRLPRNGRAGGREGGPRAKGGGAGGKFKQLTKGFQPKG